MIRTKGSIVSQSYDGSNYIWLVFLDLNAITLIIQYLVLCSRTVLWHIDPCPDAIARGEIQEHVLIGKQIYVILSKLKKQTQ